MSDIITMFSIRARHSRGELEWSVAIEPSWPVFIAASRSKHSLAANFAEDDAVGAHTQRVDDEVADGDRALAFEVRRTGFERQPVRLLQPKLGRVLDGDHALARVDHLRQGVEHRRLARAGTARDDDVHAARAGDLEHGRHLLRHRAEALHHVERDRLLGELTNRDGGAAQRQRRDDDVDAAAVLEAGVGRAAWSGRCGGRPC